MLMKPGGFQVLIAIFIVLLVHGNLYSFLDGITEKLNYSRESCPITLLFPDSIFGSINNETKW